MSSPFGIEFYAPISGFDVTEELIDHKYRVRPPSPHPAFEDYIVQATPSLGVVWIKAISPYRQVDAFGNSLRADVDRISEQLNIRYGKSKKSDFLLSGGIWDEPQYWMNALEDGQRHYCYIWSNESQANLSANLTSVYVGAASGGHETGSVAIEYSSTKIHEAEAEIQRDLSGFL